MATAIISPPLQEGGLATTSLALDWQSGKTLLECLHHVYTSGTASDVTFLVGEDKKKISAHKLILISRSPVFYAMFEGLLPEKGEILIPDIQETIFQSFLGYLYTDRIDLTVENVVPVLSAAMKYCVDILVTVCEDFLLHNLSVDNVCLFLEEAHVFTIDKLRTDCLQLIFKSAPASLRSKPFTALCASCIKSVVESDDLDAEESDVYLAITKWAEGKCSRQNLEVTSVNKREVLGDMLFLARFNTMDLNFLLQRVFLDNILTSDLAMNVVNYQMHEQIASGSERTCRPRVRKPKTKVWRCSEFSPKYNNNSISQEPVSFHVSCRAVLHGIGSLLTTTEPSTADVEVFEGKRLIKSETLLPLVKDTEEVGEIVFAKPLFLTAGTTYNVIEKASAKKRYMFRNCISEIHFDRRTITFNNSSSPTQSIPYLILTKFEDYGHKETPHYIFGLGIQPESRDAQ